MNLNLASRILTLSIFVLGAVALSSSCGSVTGGPDGAAGGATGAAGSGAGGTNGAGVAGTTGTAGHSNGGAGGVGIGGVGGTLTSRGGNGGGNAGGAGGGPLACRMDVAGDCPQGSTCACGGPGPGVCTCHRNCSDGNVCPVAEPMCGCPGSTSGTVRFCVNACFCSCQ